MANKEDYFFYVLSQLIKNPFQRIDENKFNSIVIEIFRYQYEHNQIYRKFCEYKKITPKNVRNLKEIPYLPIDIFKYGYVSCFPITDAVNVFTTSGTTFKIAGRHYFTKKSLELKDKIFIKLARELLNPDIDKFRVIVLCVPAILRNSKFLHNANVFIENFGTKDSSYFVNEKGIFETEKLIVFLKKCCKAKTPVFIFNNIDYIHKFILQCLKNNLRFPLPKGSRILLSGFKEEKVAKQEFYYQLQRIFDLPEYYLIDDYGMTESISSWYDNVVRNKLHGNKEQRCKEDPCWCKTMIVNLRNLGKVEDGKIGLIRYINLANFNTCSFIQTNDLGFKVGRGFEVIGKASKDEAHGYYYLLERFSNK